MVGEKKKKRKKDRCFKENTGKSQVLSLACGGLIPQDERESKRLKGGHKRKGNQQIYKVSV